MLNKKGSYQCRRIEVQSKETLMAPWSEAWPTGVVAAETRGSIAARQAAGSLPWFGVNDRPQRYSARKQTMLRGCRSQPTSSLVAQKSSPAPMTRSTRCREAEPWRINDTWMTATSCVTQFWCYLFCRTWTLPTPESEQSGNH